MASQLSYSISAAGFMTRFFFTCSQDTPASSGSAILSNTYRISCNCCAVIDVLLCKLTRPEPLSYQAMALNFGNRPAFSAERFLAPVWRGQGRRNTALNSLPLAESKRDGGNRTRFGGYRRDTHGLPSRRHCPQVAMPVPSLPTVPSYCQATPFLSAAQKQPSARCRSHTMISQSPYFVSRYASTANMANLRETGLACQRRKQ